jgi:hypothetical protein
MYAWQVGHQRETNVSIYSKDAVYPTRMQPELLQQFLCISRRWRHFFGAGVASELSVVEEEEMGESDGPGKKRKMLDCATQTTPKKQKMVDGTRQMTPKEESRAGDFMNEMDSTETKN